MILKPYQKKLAGIVIESTFNWYWLIEALMEEGFKVRLANPAAIVQYNGLKHTDDRYDSFWLTYLLRLGLLKEGNGVQNKAKIPYGGRFPAACCGVRFNKLASR